MYQIGKNAGEVICAGYLCVLTAIDIRYRRLPVWLLAVGIGCAVIYQVVWSDLPTALSAAGGAVGCVFLISGKATGEALGYGDGILILVLGIYLGFWNLLGMLTISFVLGAGFAMAVLVVRKFQRKTVFPFVPFLCTGYLLLLLSGVLKI